MHQITITVETMLEYGFVAFCIIGNFIWLLQSIHEARKCRKEHPECSQNFRYCFKGCKKRDMLSEEELIKLRQEILNLDWWFYFCIFIFQQQEAQTMYRYMFEPLCFFLLSFTSFMKSLFSAILHSSSPFSCIIYPHVSSTYKKKLFSYRL